MSRPANLNTRLQLLFLHLITGGVALAYRWLVSGTHYVTSGVQFVSPLAVVLLVHLLWLATRRELGTGFAIIAFGRMLTTAICIVVFTVVCAMKPGQFAMSAGFGNIEGAPNYVATLPAGF
jgi:hypothetical protein